MLLQWIADEQVTAAQTAARESGMALGLMQDMAVGVHSLGADVWWNPERFAVGSVTVGCPPDFYNQQGQDWGQPPFNPNYLAKTGYACTAKWCTTCSRTRARCASTMCSACSACGGFRRAKAHAAAHTSRTTMRR